MRLSNEVAGVTTTEKRVITVTKAILCLPAVPLEIDGIATLWAKSRLSVGKVNIQGALSLGLRQVISSTSMTDVLSYLPFQAVHEMYKYSFARYISSDICGHEYQGNNALSLARKWYQPRSATKRLDSDSERVGPTDDTHE